MNVTEPGIGGSAGSGGVVVVGLGGGVAVLEVVGSAVGVPGGVTGGGVVGAGVVTVGVTPTGGATLGTGVGVVGAGVTVDGVSGADAVTLGAVSAGPEGAAEQPTAAPAARMKAAENGLE